MVEFGSTILLTAFCLSHLLFCFLFLLFLPPFVLFLIVPFYLYTWFISYALFYFLVAVLEFTSLTYYSLPSNNIIPFHVQRWPSVSVRPWQLIWVVALLLSLPSMHQRFQIWSLLSRHNFVHLDGGCSAMLEDHSQCFYSTFSFQQSLHTHTTGGVSFHTPAPSPVADC